MGLQPHQFNRIRKSKLRNEFNNASVQHQTMHEYSRNGKINCKTQKMDTGLQKDKSIFFKTGAF